MENKFYGFFGVIIVINTIIITVITIMQNDYLKEILLLSITTFSYFQLFDISQ